MGDDWFKCDGCEEQRYWEEKNHCGDCRNVYCDECVKVEPETLTTITAPAECDGQYCFKGHGYETAEEDDECYTIMSDESHDEDMDDATFSLLCKKVCRCHPVIQRMNPGETKDLCHECLDRKDPRRDLDINDILWYIVKKPNSGYASKDDLVAEYQLAVVQKLREERLEREHIMRVLQRQKERRNRYLLEEEERQQAI